MTTTERNGPGEDFEGCVCLQDEHHRDCPAIATGRCHFQARYRADERQLKWDRRFMEMARLVAANSKDRHHRYGCVIVDNELAVLATGYNGFPRCVNDDVDARHERPAKYLYTTHAEQNAVADAARRGASLADSAVYVDDRFPCASCAGLLIQAGIRTVVARRPDLSHPRWGASWRAALEMLAEAGVEVRYLEGERVLRALPFAAAGPRSLGAFLRDPFPEGK